MNTENTVESRFKKLGSIEFLPLIVAYIVIIVFFAVTTDHFFAWSNFLNILLYTANIGILACTMTLIIVSGNIDLSIGSVIALDGIILGSVLTKGMPVGVAVAACMLVSVITGLYNAVMITRIKVNAFITTLAGMQIFRGIAYLITNGKAITIDNGFLKTLGRGYSLGIPNAVILMFIVVVVFSLIAKYTVFGRRIYVIGGNSQVAYLSGIQVANNLSGVFVLNGLVCAIATLIYCAQLGSAMPTNATGMEFDVITAVVLGGTSMAGGKGTIAGALIGALLISTLNNGMVMMNVQTYWQDVIGGIVLVVAVIFDILKNRKK